MKNVFDLTELSHDDARATMNRGPASLCNPATFLPCNVAAVIRRSLPTTTGFQTSLGQPLLESNAVGLGNYWNAQKPEVGKLDENPFWIPCYFPRR
jgi:hypothetical protein